jgi:hypothetical protein
MSAERWRSLIDRVVRDVRPQLDNGRAWIEAQVQTESAGRPDVRSGVGAIGLLQLMPATADEMGVRNPLDPEENLRRGVREGFEPAASRGHNLVFGEATLSLLMLRRGQADGREAVFDEALGLVAAAVRYAPIRPETSETTACFPHLNRSQSIRGRAAMCVGLEHDDFARAPEGWIGPVSAVYGGQGMGQHVRPGA